MNPRDRSRQVDVEREIAALVLRLVAEGATNERAAEMLDRRLRQIEMSDGKEERDRIAQKMGLDDEGPRWGNVDIERVGFSTQAPRDSFKAYTDKEKEIEARRGSEVVKTTDKNQLASSVQSGREPLSPTSPTERVITHVIRGEYSYGKLGLILGVLSIVGGVTLGLNGVAGQTSWTASFLGLQSQINDAAPGVVLFVVGLFMIVVTKPKVRIRDFTDQ